MNERFADRELDAERVRRALETCRPGFVPATIEWLGAGWDNDAWLVDGTWVFRFPRRRAVLPWFERELRVLPLVAERVRVAVPRVEFTGAPGPHFPYPFMGYRFVPGVPGDLVPDDLPADAERRMALGIGRMLTELHAVPVDAARALGAPEHRFDPRDRLVRARESLPALEAMLPPAHARAYRALVDGAVAPPRALPASSPLVRFTHGDLGSEHMLFDPDTLEPSGLIDFADQGLRDPAIDFVGILHWRGERFTRIVLEGYGLETDPGLLDRARYDAAVGGGVWLAEAAANGRPEDVVRQRRCFERGVVPALAALLGDRAHDLHDWSDDP